MAGAEITRFENNLPASPLIRVPTDPQVTQGIREAKADNRTSKALLYGAPAAALGGAALAISTGTAPIAAAALPAYAMGKILPRLGSYRDVKEIVKKFAFLSPDLNPQDGIIPESDDEALLKRLEEQRIVLDHLKNTLKQDIPKEVMDEFNMLRDPAKRKTMLDANITQIALSFYFVARLQTVNNVLLRSASLPTHLADAVAALSLFTAEFLVRGYCTWGFQEGMISSIQRNGEYYYANMTERSRVTGFDPTDKYGIRMDHGPSRYTLAHVGYIYTEKDQLHRNLMSALLFETQDHDIYFNCNAGLNNAQVLKEYMPLRDEILSFAEGLKSIVMSAYGKHKSDAAAGRYDAATEAARVKKVFGKMRDAYLGQAKKYHRAGGIKEGNREQDNGGALDHYFAEQFEAHARKFDQRIAEIDEQLAAGTFDAARAKEYYEYLKNKYTVDIVLNLRGWENHASTEFLGNRLADVRQRLNQGILNNPVNQYYASMIVDAVKASITAARATYNPKLEKNISAIVLKAVTERMTGEDLAKLLLMEGISQDPYEGGEKAGGQNYLFDKMGKTFIIAKTAGGTRMQFTKEEWLSTGSDAILSTAQKNRVADMKRAALTHLIIPGIKPAALMSGLNEDAVEQVVNIAVSAARIKDREKLRIIERLTRSYIKDGNTVEDFMTEILKLGVYDGEITWEVFKKPDFMASFDKDYVRRTINPQTLLFEDIFRYDIPVYEKLMASGKSNISMIQSEQNYAYTLNRGTDENGNPVILDHPLEATAQSAAMDQNMWYGALVQLLADCNLMLGNSITEGLTVEQFIDRCVATFLTKADQITRNTLAQGIKNEMSGMLGRTVDRALGKEVIERLKARAEYHSSLSAVGLLTGRDVRNHSGFNCGTDRMEHLKEIIAYNDQYTLDRNGRVMAQTLVKFNPRTGRMDMSEHLERYSQQVITGAGPLTKAAENKEICQGHILTEAQKRTIKDQYTAQGFTVDFAREEIEYYRGSKTLSRIGDLVEKLPGDDLSFPTPIEGIKDTVLAGEMAPKIERNKVLIKDAAGRVVKVIYYYYPPIQQKNEKTGEMETVSIDQNDINLARRVEIDYTYDRAEIVHSSKVIKDYSPDGAEYIETKLVYNREIRDIFRGTQVELDLALANYGKIAEVAGHRVIETLPDGRLVVEIMLKVPQIESKRKATDGSYAEKLQTPLCIIYDKAITEDMGTTYKEEQQGFEMAITPFDVGRGMAPAQGASLVKQHYRWTDGQRCYHHNKPFYAQHPSLMSAKGWEKKQAFAWYQHALSDIMLNAVPLMYWAGTAATMSGILPLKPDDDSFLLIFGAMTVSTLYNYYSKQTLVDQDSITRWDKIRAVWNKETLIRFTAPGYFYGSITSYNDVRKEFNVTESGGRQRMPYEFLLFNSRLSKATGIPALAGGAAFIPIQIWGAGSDASLAVYAGWLLAAGFPALTWAQLRNGTRVHYSWWTSFKDASKATILVNGGKEIRMYEAKTYETNEKDPLLAKKREVENPSTVTISFITTDAAKKAVNRVTKEMGMFNPVTTDEDRIIAELSKFAAVKRVTHTPDGKTIVVLGIKTSGMYDPARPDQRAYIDGLFWERHDMMASERLYSLANASRRNSWLASRATPAVELVRPMPNAEFGEQLTYLVDYGIDHYKKTSVALDLAERSVTDFEALLREAGMKSANKKDLNKYLGDVLGRPNRTNRLVASNERMLKNLIDIIRDERATDADIKRALVLATRMLYLTKRNTDAAVLATKLLTGQTIDAGQRPADKAISTEILDILAARAGNTANDPAFRSTLEKLILDSFKTSGPADKAKIIVGLINGNQAAPAKTLLSKQNEKEINGILEGTSNIGDELKVLDVLATMPTSSSNAAEAAVKTLYGIDLATLRAFAGRAITDPEDIVHELAVYSETLNNGHLNRLAKRVFGADRMQAILDANARANGHIRSLANFRTIIR